MNKSLWVVAVLTLSTSRAFAHDSWWLLCTGTGTETIADKATTTKTKNGIAVSYFDERYKAVHRLDSFHLLFGGRRFDASLVDFDIVDPKTKQPNVVLKEGTSTLFDGQIRVSVSQASTTMSLTGKMRKAYDPSQEMVPFEATLTCKDMSEFGSD